MRILALGDSITDGWTDYSNTSHGGYRLKLDAKLDAAGISADFVGSQKSGPFADNQHEGYAGKTIDWLVGKAHSVVPTYKPDIILLMAGNNDTKTDSVATMKADMSKLIDTLAHDAPNATILVAGVAPARPGNLSGQSVSVGAEYNKALPGLVAQKAAAGLHVKFVDTSKLTVNDMSPIGPDRGTHLSQAGYEKLADIWFDAIKKVVPASGGDDHTSTPTPPVTPPSTGGTNHGVTAVDDKYTMDAGKKFYFNTSHLVFNDKGIDGGLKTTVAAKSANGVTLEKWDDGTIVYRAGTANGTDKIDYVLTDKDGSTDTGSVIITIKNGSVTSTPSTPPVTPPKDPSNDSGSNHGVTAVDDKYTMDAGKKLYFNTSHLVFNDKGADGGLKTTVAAKSANGVTLDKWDDGTIVYRAGTANGTDKIDYVLTDKDGSTDTGSVIITVKNGTVTSTPSTPTPPATHPDLPSDGGKGHAVVAGNDSYKLDAGKTFYFNTGYLTMNDKGADGGLRVVSLDAATERGVKVTWKADGTAIYKAPAGFDGVDKIHYTVADKDGSSDTGTISFHVHDLLG
jgi:lysophospholipase L1-like esterase